VSGWHTRWVGIWTPAEGPGSRARRSWFFDAGVAVVALLAAGTYVYSSDLPIWVAVTIAVAMAAPLVVRRVWPLPVFAWCLLVAVGTGAVAMQVVWSPALVIALYTVAVLRPRRDAIVAAVLLAGGAVASSIHIFGRTWLSPGVSLVAVIAAATVLGLYVRTRHALFNQLIERAHDLEKGRDQQVALAAADERARIAREMHDIVAHHLTVMIALSDGAAAQLTTAPQRAEAAMRAVSATGRQAIGDTRHLLGVLRDPDESSGREPLPDLGGLDRLIDQVRAAGLAVHYEVQGALPVGGPGPQLAIYRLVQEALTNTLKHAGPHATAYVRMRYEADEVCVEIADDGLGTAGAMPPGDGRGLAGMRERIEAFGGHSQSGPRTPRGWLVSARVPLPAGPQP
jgi:signal transduction histidine kinase